MDIYMRRIFEKENARVLKKMNEMQKKNEELQKQKSQGDSLLSDCIKLMMSQGMSVSDISEKTKVSSEFIKAVISAS